MNLKNNFSKNRYAELPEFSIEFQEVHKCPLCSEAVKQRSPLLLTSCRFGKYQIHLPSRGVNLVECINCGLYYKDMIPTSAELARLFDYGAMDVWADKRIAFSTERNLLSPYLQEGDGSLMDIGSSDGALLRAMDSIAPIRSALDVYDDPRCRDSVTGEYLIGFIEDDALSFSRRYNVATAFDVFEHFYSLDAVARNLRCLLADDGIVFGETGDSGQVISPTNWWYVNLIEHHIFWNRKSLEYFCCQYGFKIEKLVSTAHKGRRYMSVSKRLLAWTLHCSRNTRIADLLWRVKRLDACMIGNPYHQDHVIFALRKL
jgi:hypothetical protein